MGFAASHVVKPVIVPTTACKTLCARTTDCCQWAVRDVRSWQDAKDADSGLSELGWVIAGEEFSLFPDGTTPPANQWCITAACTTKTEKFVVKRDDTAGTKQLVFNDFDDTDAHTTNIQLVNILGDNGVNSFDALLILINKGFDLYDRIGKGVTFVRSFSCGLFKKET